MRYVLDIETDALVNISAIHVVVCRDIDAPDTVHVFRHVHQNIQELQALIDNATLLVGHNILPFDLKVLKEFGLKVPLTCQVLDTLRVSFLLHYHQEGGHSLERWGSFFGNAKSSFDDYSTWSQQLEDRCIQDTLINLKLYQHQSDYITSPRWQNAIALEHFAAQFCDVIHDTGFQFDVETAKKYFTEVSQKVEDLESSFQSFFPPKRIVKRVIIPKLTAKGTLHQKDFLWVPIDPVTGVRDLSQFEAGVPYELAEYKEFNPKSAKDRIDRLNEAGWKPFERTKGHLAALRDKSTPPEKLEHYEIYGWKTSEANLATLPETAPEGAKALALYLLLSSRLSNLKEWLSLAKLDDKTQSYRVHGTFNHIGSWSHRCSHNHPNMANVASDGPYGHEFRALWTVPSGSKLVGVDADSIQLRIFAHLCEDERLIQAIERGRKEDQTDIHSMNKNIIGAICKTRDTAKTYIYAQLLGAQLAKIAEIFGCTRKEAEEAQNRILDFYPGWKKLLNGRLAREGFRKYIEGLDGRMVILPESRLALTAHLQSGEKIIMAHAARLWTKAAEYEQIQYKPVNWVHDEWQSEVLDVNGMPERLGQLQIEGIRLAGVDLNMCIKLDGNAKIGSNWSETH